MQNQSKVGKYIFNVTRLNEGSLGKGLFFHETRPKKIFRLLSGKNKFELALHPSTASMAKIQIQFSRQID